MLKHDKFMARSRSQIEVAVSGFFRFHTITARINEILTFGYYRNVYSGDVTRSILLVIAQFLQYHQHPAGFYRISSVFPKDCINLCVNNIYDTGALIRDKDNIDDVDLYHWIGVIRDLKDTPYEGGSFYIQIIFPQDYPFKPIKNRFITKVYSCNISEKGGHGLDIDKDNWSPAMTLRKLMLCLTSMLQDANPDDPIRPELARLYKEDRKTYEKNAREETKKHAM